MAAVNRLNNLTCVISKTLCRLGLCDNGQQDNEQQIMSITINILISNDRAFYTFSNFTILKLLFIHIILSFLHVLFNVH